MSFDYQTVFRELNEAGVDYLVVGGLAVNLHGIPRMTYDIDLMILLEPDNILRLIDKLMAWGFRPRAPVNPYELADQTRRDAWIKEKGMTAMSFSSDTLPLAEIDIVIDSPISYLDLKKRAVVFDLEGDPIPTIAIQDLIDLKLRVGRRQDLADVEHLRIILER
jgi:hypothetical protein